MGTIGDLRFEVYSTGQVVRHEFYPIWFSASFDTPPVFLAELQTTNGGDPANLRWQHKDHETVEVMVCEEQSNDSEIGHVSEVVGYMLFEVQN